jgi:hypothetical protein
MKIPPKTLSEAVKEFKKFGTMTIPLLMRMFKVSPQMGQEIIDVIAKRYPNLWANREVNREKKWIEGMKP